MSSTTLNGDHRGGEPWQIAERDRLSGVALEGHALTFLVGMPGSGRTTVLRQMQAKLETVGEAHVWCSSRSELQRVLDGLADGKRSGRLAVIVDDVIVAQDDQLWDRIRRLVMPADGDEAPDRGSAPRFLIASLSMPDWASVHGASGVVLRPRDLAFDASELNAVLAANAPGSPRELRMQLLDSFAGHPLTTRVALERFRANAHAEGWSVVSGSSSAALTLQELRRFDPAELDRVDAVRMMRATSVLRRLSREDLHLLAPELTGDHWFDQLASSPYGVTEINPVSLDVEFVWHADTFARLSAERSPDEVRALAARAVAAFPGESNVMQRLFLSLRARAWGEVESIAQRHFRTIYEYAPRETVEEMLQAPASVLPRLVSTNLLIALFRWRRFGATRSVLHSLRESSIATTRIAASDPIGLFSQVTRHSLATSFGGDRAAAERCLRDAKALIRDADGKLHAALHASPIARGRFAADCLVLVWAATLLEDMPLALELSNIAAEHGQSFNRTDTDALRHIEIIGVIAGVRQSDAAKLTGRSLPGFADCFDLLDNGEEAKARDLARQLRDLPRSVLPHDTGASVRILLEALVGDEDPIAEVDELLELSAASWRDGLPSTLLTLSATTFYLTRGQSVRAQKAADYSGAEGDCYVSVARALVELANGRPGEALAHAEAALADDKIAPRFASIARTLAALCVLRLGNLDAAANRIATMATQCLDDRNARFALRFATTSDAALMTSISDRLPKRIADLLVVSALDSRPLSDSTVGEELSSAEIEVLRLVGRNWSNAQIAAQRFVSVHTVRAQLRSVFRKLGASDRRSAVAAAERRGLLD
ncbi:LuxR C-terminal-related transcriptional regulator [Pseudoclavibacter terrae]|uniref:LuxR C-terminal-related transcriptional regulator n=1 Tax=Pseudoclavibacter terrae TaxID=1530195 RepID=UPI00232EE2F3|nr:LuxR C-terminal-related transcriptional regulator [Pseudoclavibacter terrae]